MRKKHFYKQWQWLSSEHLLGNEIFEQKVKVCDYI